MTENNVNTPLLRKAVEWAEAEAAKPYETCEWMQSRYIIRSAKDADQQDEWERDVFAMKDESCGTCFCIAGYVANQATGNLSYHAAEGIAKQELGLNDWQADQLFCGSNSITQVRNLAEQFAGEKL